MFMTLARGGSLSLREGVPALGLRTDYLRHFREAGRSVRERQCWSCVARPIIYDTSARRLSQFARGSTGPASPAPLFATLPRDGCLSSREAVLVGCRPPHYLRHFWGSAGYPSWDAKVHGNLRDFPHCVPYFFDSVGFSDGKSPNGTRAHAEGQRHPWVFRPFDPGSEIIRTNI